MPFEACQRIQELLPAIPPSNILGFGRRTLTLTPKKRATQSISVEPQTSTKPETTEHTIFFFSAVFLFNVFFIFVIRVRNLATMIAFSGRNSSRLPLTWRIRLWAEGCEAGNARVLGSPLSVYLLCLRTTTPPPPQKKKKKKKVYIYIYMKFR